MEQPGTSYQNVRREADYVSDSEQESWQNARGYAGLMGAIPSSFTTTIRYLVTDHQKQAPLSGPSRHNALRLLKSGSVQAPFYYATLSFFADRYTSPKDLTPEKILEIYRPIDIAAFLGLIYLYRKAKRMVPEDQWSYIAQACGGQTDAGVHVGFAMQPIGLAVGALCGGLPGVALAMFMKHDAKGFKEYRRHLKATGVFYDHEVERSRWGCTSAQIASAWVQLIGLGINESEAFVRGLECVTPNGEGLNDDQYRWFITRRWLEAIMTTGDIPNITHKGKYYPMKEALERLRENTRGLLENGAKSPWLEKGKEDLTQAAPTAQIDDATDAELGLGDEEQPPAE